MQYCCSGHQGSGKHTIFVLLTRGFSRVLVCHVRGDKHEKCGDVEVNTSMDGDLQLSEAPRPLTQ